MEEVVNLNGSGVNLNEVVDFVNLNEPLTLTKSLTLTDRAISLTLPGRRGSGALGLGWAGGCDRGPHFQNAMQNDLRP
jgi:hypothetical protein